MLALLPPYPGSHERIHTYVDENLGRPEPGAADAAVPVRRLDDPGTPSWLAEALPDVLVAIGAIPRELPGALGRAPTLLAYHPTLLPQGRPGDPACHPLYLGRPDLLGATITVRRDGGAEEVVCRARIPEGRVQSVEEAEGAVHVAGIRALVSAASSALRGDRLRSEARIRGASRSRRTDSFVRAVSRIQLEASRRPWPGLHRALETVRGMPVPSPRIRGLPPGVYVFCYHSVVDPSRAEPWETGYGRVATRARNFARHMEYLSAHMTPISLADAPARLAGGPADRPYFAVTFDDGYRNLLRNAEPVCRGLGIRPTVFANAAFASREAVYHRVLLAVLAAEGHAGAAAAVFDRTFRTGDFTAQNLLRLSKERYRHGTTERATLEAWRTAHGDAPHPRAHLSFEELARLRDGGWFVGNHTRTHPSLSRVEGPALRDEIAGNHRALRDHGLDPLPWLAYPNGRACDVETSGILRWIREAPDRMGAFAAGGVNVFPSRAEWMRIPVGDLDLSGLQRTIRRNLELTWQVCRSLSPYPGSPR
jgi:peptidoglycan/xylan/chitin deacetylase (PgdA/CDA1 family)